MARRLLTPNEVRTATLHATWLRGGYDTDETDELLDEQEKNLWRNMGTCDAQDEWLDKARDLLEIARKAVSE